jgi:two-component system, response regulator
MTRQPVILLVEDNDDDAKLTLMAFQRAHVSNSITRVSDGIAALDYLARNSDLPAVVLLDLNLPRMSGLEVLKAIRANERTALLPVVVLTSSVEEQDRLTAYQHHCNSYVQKPVDYDQFVVAARQLGLYWMVLNVAAPS